MEVRVLEKEKMLQVRRWRENDEAIIVANFSDEPQGLIMNGPSGPWAVRLDTADQRLLGGITTVLPSVNLSEGARLSLSPKSLIVFQKSG
jgi:hypothetical protein